MFLMLFVIALFSNFSQLDTLMKKKIGQEDKSQEKTFFFSNLLLEVYVTPSSSSKVASLFFSSTLETNWGF